MITQEASRLMKNLKGQHCTRKKIGENRSLSLGFGEKISDSINGSGNGHYSKWEIGSYYPNWSVFKKNKLLFSTFKSELVCTELDNLLQGVRFGVLDRIQQAENKEVSIYFESGTVLVFYCLEILDDEAFHMFCPDDMYIEYGLENGWKVGRADEPWF